MVEDRRMTTVQVNKTVRYILEILQGRYQSTSMNNALLEYFQERDPLLLDGADEIDRIVNRGER